MKKIKNKKYYDDRETLLKKLKKIKLDQKGKRILILDSAKKIIGKTIENGE